MKKTMNRSVVIRGGEFLRMGQWILWSYRTLEEAGIPTALGGDHRNSRIIEFEIGR